jgi:hypothetical protein
MVFDVADKPFLCQSKHLNKIAFSCDVALLLRVLRGALALLDADGAVEVKLRQKKIVHEGEEQSKPYLNFVTTVRAARPLYPSLPPSRSCPYCLLYSVSTIRY